MTTCSVKSPVTRITPAMARDLGARQILATIDGPLLVLRAKGLRSRETLHIGALYEQAIKARVMEKRKERANARKGRR